MTVSIIVEDENWNELPGIERLAKSAIDTALRRQGRSARKSSVTILFTNDGEMTSLNSAWRGKSRPTNVLSFPAAAGRPIPGSEPEPLGDIVLASGVVAREAAAQGKSLAFHVTHLIVHGCLHLLGHDHEASEAEADQMEAIEVEILAELGYPSPYLAEERFPD